MEACEIRTEIGEVREFAAEHFVQFVERVPSPVLLGYVRDEDLFDELLGLCLRAVADRQNLAVLSRVPGSQPSPAAERARVRPYLPNAVRVEPT